MSRRNIFSVGEFDDEGAESAIAGESEPEEVEEVEEEEEEITPQASPSPLPSSRVRTRPAAPRPSNGNGLPKIRTRPMPASLRQAWPKVTTMLITNEDGSQILFIRAAS